MIVMVMVAARRLVFLAVLVAAVRSMVYEGAIAGYSAVQCTEDPIDIPGCTLLRQGWMQFTNAERLDGNWTTIEVTASGQCTSKIVCLNISFPSLSDSWDLAGVVRYRLGMLVSSQPTVHPLARIVSDWPTRAPVIGQFASFSGASAYTFAPEQEYGSIIKASQLYSNEFGMEAWFHTDGPGYIDVDGIAIEAVIACDAHINGLVDEYAEPGDEIIITGVFCDTRELDQVVTCVFPGDLHVTVTTVSASKVSCIVPDLGSIPTNLEVTVTLNGTVNIEETATLRYRQLAPRKDKPDGALVNNGLHTVIIAAVASGAFVLGAAGFLLLRRSSHRSGVDALDPSVAMVRLNKSSAAADAKTSEKPAAASKKSTVSASYKAPASKPGGKSAVSKPGGAIKPSERHRKSSTGSRGRQNHSSGTRHLSLGKRRKRSDSKPEEGRDSQGRRAHDSAERRGVPAGAAEAAVAHRMIMPETMAESMPISAFGQNRQSATTLYSVTSSQAPNIPGDL